MVRRAHVVSAVIAADATIDCFEGERERVNRAVAGSVNAPHVSLVTSADDVCKSAACTMKQQPGTKAEATHKEWHELGKAVREGLRFQKWPEIVDVVRQGMAREASNLLGDHIIKARTAEASTETEARTVFKKPVWLEAVDSMQNSVARQILFIGREGARFSDNVVKPGVRTLSGSSVRLLGNLRHKLAIKNFEAFQISLRENERSLALDFRPAWREINRAWKKKVIPTAISLREKVHSPLQKLSRNSRQVVRELNISEQALVIREMVRPRLEKLSRGVVNIVRELNIEKHIAFLQRLAKQLLEHLSQHVRKEIDHIPDILKGIGHSHQPRLRPLSRASGHISQDVAGHTRVIIKELEDVSRNLKVAAAAEEVIFVLQKIGDFPTLEAILCVFRGTMSHRLTRKLSKLVADLEHDPLYSRKRRAKQ